MAVTAVLAAAACTSTPSAPEPPSPSSSGAPAPDGASSTAPPAFAPPDVSSPPAAPSPRLPSQRAPTAPEAPPGAAGDLRLGVAQPTTCQELAAARFLVAVSARRQALTVRVTGHPATAECGGPDGVRYVVAQGLVDVLLRPDAPVALAGGDGAADLRPLAQDALPGRLADDSRAPTFLVSGPWNGATALTEQARP